jgi:hypothetical protein
MPLKCPEVDMPLKCPEVEMPLECPEIEMPLKCPEVEMPLKCPEVFPARFARRPPLVGGNYEVDFIVTMKSRIFRIQRSLDPIHTAKR